MLNPGNVGGILIKPMDYFLQALKKTKIISFQLFMSTTYNLYLIILVLSSEHPSF